MSYKNAENILPKELLRQIQEYVDGECLYIPRKEESKLSWGELTSTKKVLEARNDAICKDYANGMSTVQLAEKYYLSVKSIQRIIYNGRKKQ